MLHDLLLKAEVKLISALLTAVSACIALVALAFAIYAGLKIVVVPSAAAAGTALIFAVATKLIGMVAPKLIHPSHDEEPPKPNLIASITEIGAVGMTILGEAAAHRRREKRR